MTVYVLSVQWKGNKYFSVNAVFSTFEKAEKHRKYLHEKYDIEGSLIDRFKLDDRGIIE